MSADILFLKDIQDVWLFSHFIENGYFQKNHKLYFMIETTAKISAIQNWPGFVKSLGINETNMNHLRRLYKNPGILSLKIFYRLNH